MNYGKYKFEQAKKEKEARKKQKTFEVKEIRITPNIEQHDFEFKAKNARKFIEDGNKVKITVRFRGRELNYVKLGEAVLNDFIETYMKSKTRKSIDNAMAYTITMDAPDLMDYFLKTEHYSFKKGEQFRGFFPDWLGEFYAYYQWYYNIPSSDLTSKIPVDFLRKAYPGIHDLELELAVQKVGIQ